MRSNRHTSMQSLEKKDDAVGAAVGRRGPCRAPRRARRLVSALAGRPCGLCGLVEDVVAARRLVEDVVAARRLVEDVPVEKSKPNLAMRPPVALLKTKL